MDEIYSIEKLKKEKRLLINEIKKEKTYFYLLQDNGNYFSLNQHYRQNPESLPCEGKIVGIYSPFLSPYIVRSLAHQLGVKLGYAEFFSSLTT